MSRLQLRLQSIFPELKESEDESIRKEIVSAINIYCSEYLRGTKVRNDMLAWLEKKKERGLLSKDEEYTLARIIEYLEDNDCPSEWKDLLHDIYALPYQKEQKFTWSEEDEQITKRIDSLLYSIHENEFEDIHAWLKSLKDRVQPKIEWSEEDETRLTNIIIMLKEGASIHFNKKDITKAIDWLNKKSYQIKKVKQ